MGVVFVVLIFVGSFVIVRRYGFSNDQWQIPEAQLLRVKYASAGRFAADPSEVIFTRKCIERTRRLWGKKAKVGRDAERAPRVRRGFEYVWMILPPDFDMRARPGLVPIWRGRDSVLFRVVGPYWNGELPKGQSPTSRSTSD